MPVNEDIENGSHRKGSRKVKSKSNLEKSKNQSGSQESLIKKNENSKSTKARQQMRARFQVLLPGENAEKPDTNDVIQQKRKRRTKTADSAVSERRSEVRNGVKKAHSADNLLDSQLYTKREKETTRKTRKHLSGEIRDEDNVDGRVGRINSRAKKGRGKALKSKDQNVQERRDETIVTNTTKEEDNGKENQAYDVSPDRRNPRTGEEATRPRKKRTKKKALAEPLPDRIARVLNTKKRNDAQLLGIEIHKADRLNPDIHVCHPLVRVHVIDSVSGQYVKKSNKERNVSSYYETQNESVDYVLPQMTQPYDFKKFRSLTPAWDELLIYNEVYSYFLQREPDDPKAILVFELLDFLSMPAVSRKENDSHNTGWYRIAWAFLKIVGADNSLNTDRKVRLQLYNFPIRMKTRNMVPGAIEPFQWFISRERQTYPSTLYVTIKGIRPPNEVPPSSRSMFPIQEERGRQTYEEFSSSVDAKGARIRDQDPGNDDVVWSRLPGQLNRVPNKHLLSLPAGRKGCSITRFSNKGRYLACACTTTDSYPVVVYKIPSGDIHAEFSGHFGIVYDISWSTNDEEIVTASSDSTARTWDISRGVKSCIKLYPHPSFVYAVKHHPLRPSLIVTGGYDSVIRVWTEQTDNVNGEILKTFMGHTGFINSICFNAEGNLFYSADSNGTIIEWKTSQHHGSQEKTKEARVEKWHKQRVIKLDELKGTSISSIKLHPGGQKILLHTKNSTLQMLDLRAVLIMKKYHGCINFKDHLRSTLSSCGSYVFGTSEDGWVRVWGTETGDLVHIYRDLGYNGAVNDVDFHPMDNFVAFCSFGASHSIIVYSYEPNEAVSIPAPTTKDHRVNVMPEVQKSRSPFATELTTQNYNKTSSSAENLRSKLLEELSAPLATSVIEQRSPAQPVRLGGTERTLDSMGLTRSTWGSEFSTYQDTTRSPTNLPKEYYPTASPHAHQHLGASAHVPAMSGDSKGLYASPYNSEDNRGKISNNSRSKRELPKITLSEPQVTQKQQMPCRVMAVYEYIPSRTDEMLIKPGDHLVVLEKESNDWWIGRHPDGREGYFPALYVVDAPDDFENDQQTSKSHAKEAHSAVIGRDGDLKIVSAPEVNPDLETSKRRQRRRKEHAKDSKKTGSAEMF